MNLELTGHKNNDLLEYPTKEKQGLPDSESINIKSEEQASVKFLIETGSLRKDKSFDFSKFLENTSSEKRMKYRYTVIDSYESQDTDQINNSLKNIQKELKALGLSDERVNEMINKAEENTTPIYKEKSSRAYLSLISLLKHLSSEKYNIGTDEVVQETPFYIPNNIKSISDKKTNTNQMDLWEVKGMRNTDIFTLDDGNEVPVAALYIAQTYPELITSTKNGKVFAKYFLGVDEFELSNKTVLQGYMEKVRYYERVKTSTMLVISSLPGFSIENDKLIFDTNIETDTSALYKDIVKSISTFQTFGNQSEIIVDVLSKIKVLSRIEQEGLGNDDQLQEKPFIKIPADISDLCSGYEGEGICSLSEILNTRFIGSGQIPINLEDGITNIDEVKLARFLHDRFTYRDEKEACLYFRNDNGDKEKLSLETISAALGYQGSNLTTADLSEKFPYLIQSGKIEVYDFFIDTRMSETFRNYGGRENPLSVDGRPSYRAFTSANGITGKYYFGRGTLINTNIPLKNLSVIQLSPDMVGIISDSFGKKTLLYELELLSGEDVQSRKTEFINGYIEKHGKDPSSAVIASHLTFNKKMVEKQINSYDVSSLLNEELKNIDPVMKNKVLSVIGDYEFIARDMRKILAPLDLGIARYPWKEQLLTAAALAYVEDESEMLGFLNKHREAGLKTITSILYGGIEMSQKILTIAEKIPTESANAIFSKYAEIVDITRDIENFVQAEFDDELSKDPKIIESLKSKLLERGVKILDIFHSKIEALTTENETEMSHVIEESLSKISVNALATLSAFKYARDHSKRITLEDVKNSEFSKKDMQQVSKEDAQYMSNMYYENYAHNPEFAQKLVTKFNDGFTNKSLPSDLYTYRLSGSIEAFARFKEFKDGKHLSAVNVSESSRGYALGEALVEQAIERESLENILYAETDFSKGICGKFLESGFVVTQGLDFEGVEAVDIVCDQELNKKYLSKNLTQQGIIDNENIPTGVIIETYSDIKEFDRGRLGDLVVTRSFNAPDSSLWYIALEEKKTKNQV